MKIDRIGLLLFSSFQVALSSKFVDDIGNEFDFQGAPTVAVRAGVGAISLYHFGAYRHITDETSL